MNFLVRKAHKMDCKDIIELLKKQSKEFEERRQIYPDIKVTEKDLEINGFKNDPAFSCYVACVAGKLVGFAIYYYKYSIWNGKSLFLEHIYVLPGYRCKNIGTRLLTRVAQDALSNNCFKMELDLIINMNNEFFRNKGVIMENSNSESFRYPHEISKDTLKKLVSKA